MSEYEPYSKIIITEIEATGLPSKYYPFCTVNVGDKKYQLEASSEKTGNPKWLNTTSFVFDIADPKELNGSHLKIAFWSKDKWKKNKFLGECNVSLSTLLRSTNSAAASGSSDESSPKFNTCEFPLVNEKSTKKSDKVDSSTHPNVRFCFEVTGWKIIYDLLSDKQTVSNALLSLLSAASSKDKKSRNYIRKDILKVMKTLVLDSDVKVELKENVSKLWNKLAKKDDETLLLLVKEGILEYIADLIVSVKDTNLKVLFIEDLKCFFKYVSHQQEMIKLDILKILINLISTPNVAVQTKAFEVILHFDTVHQQEMINLGIVKRLNELIFNDNLQIQTRALAVVQYFDVTHQQKIIDEGILANILTLMSTGKHQLQLKALAVLQHFDAKFKDQMIADGVLKHLSVLIAVDNLQLRLKAFEVVNGFVESHQEKLITEGILSSLVSFLHDTNVQVKIEALSIISKFNAQYSIKEGILKYLTELIYDQNKGIQAKAFEVIRFMDVVHQEQMKDEGLLARLIDLIAVEEEKVELPKPSEDIIEEPPVLKKDETFYIDVMEEWSCSACTFLNEPSSSICAICGTDKPTHSTRSTLQDILDTTVEKHETVGSSNNDDKSLMPPNEINISKSEEAETEEPPSQWACIACTFLNEATQLTECSICSTPKPPSSTKNVSSDEPTITSTSTNATDVEVISSTDQSSARQPMAAEQICQVLEVLRHFDVQYQQDMINQGLLKYLRILLGRLEIQNEVVKTISYFEGAYHANMIENGILLRLVSLISPKNAKIFLLMIQRFEGYQVEIIAKDLLKPILKLLSYEDIQMQTRVSDFLLNFDDQYHKQIIDQLKALSGTTDSKDGPKSANEVCKLCGGIGGHLTTCNLRNKPQELGVNYTLRSQARKILWQLDNGGIRILKYKVLYNDGGEYSRKYKIKNLLSPNSSVYSSESVPTANIVFQYEGKGQPILTHVILKGPRARFDSPIKTATVFISDVLPDIKSTRKFDNLTFLQFEEMQKSGLAATDPVAFLELTDTLYCEVPLRKPMKATYVHMKLLTALKKNFDVEYIGFVGVSSQSDAIPESLNPKLLSDVGNYLGVKKRIKKFEYVSDFDKNGLLYWIGSSEGEKPWNNPFSTGQIIITTSHPMYSGGMRIEDIVSREGGNSCYWGSTCPQYFILDLKHRRLRPNYFTLRHGYQAANSYIQNWTFSCSNDQVNWITLYEGGETPFNRAFDTKSWPVPDGKDFFRYFRVLQKGNYSMGRGTSGGGSAYLCISGFEVYGDLLLD